MPPLYPHQFFSTPMNNFLTTLSYFLSISTFLWTNTAKIPRFPEAAYSFGLIFPLKRSSFMYKTFLNHYNILVHSFHCFFTSFHISIVVLSSHLSFVRAHRLDLSSVGFQPSKNAFSFMKAKNDAHNLAFLYFLLLLYFRRCLWHALEIALFLSFIFASFLLISLPTLIFYFRLSDQVFLFLVPWLCLCLWFEHWGSIRFWDWDFDFTFPEYASRC